MNEMLKQIAENILGIWVNKDYELVLSLPPTNVFILINKKDKEETQIDGSYIITQLSGSNYPILRLIESEGEYEDYVINELSVFSTLTIFHEGEEITLINQPPEESRFDVI